MKIIFTIAIASLFTLKAYSSFLPDSFSANFSQEYTSSLKGKIKKGTGTIEYKYPSSIRFETNNPTHVLYVTNGSKVWYYSFPFIDGEEGELTVSNLNAGNGMFTKFFDSLKNGLSSNNLYDVKVDNGNYLLKFKESTMKSIGIKTAKLIFLKSSELFNNLQSIEVEFSDSKKSILSFADMKINPSIESNRFVFEAPVNLIKGVQKN